MRKILWNHLTEDEWKVIIMVHRKNKDLAFYHYYNFRIESDVQKMKYTLEPHEVEYYQGRNNG